jgi:uncharacterized membrane protein (UPF0127 family)
MRAGCIQTMTDRRRLSTAALSAVILLHGLSTAFAADDCPRATELPRGQISVTTRTGTARLDVEIADNNRSRAAGLMCRTSLAEGAGMLFVYPRPQVARMWMKNTLIPLDIVFIDAKSHVVKIAANVTPGDETRVNSGVPVLRVLELPAGAATRHGIEVGARVSTAG